MEKKIAKIKNAHLGYEDHGIFTCWLDLDYGSSAQGAGLYALDQYNKETKEREGTAVGLEFIIRLMQACGVREWDKIVGRTVYAHCDHSKVYGIEPLPTEGGRTFMFEDLFSQYKEYKNNPFGAGGTG